MGGNDEGEHARPIVVGRARRPFISRRGGVIQCAITPSGAVSRRGPRAASA
jgi:hypothetical protein